MATTLKIPSLKLRSEDAKYLVCRGPEKAVACKAQVQGSL